MSIGDLTIQDLLKRKKVTVKKNMTVADFVAAVSKLGPYLALIPGLAALMSVLKTINLLLNTAAQLYAQAVKLYEQIKKLISIASGVLTGNPNTVNDTAKETQKTAINQAKAQVKVQYDQLKTKVLMTPLRTLSNGAVP